MDPGPVIPDSIRDRGDGLVKEPGFARLHSVIPDLIRNPSSSERDGGRVAGKNRYISGPLQPIEMDPGSSPGVTGTEGIRVFARGDGRGGGHGPRVRHPGLDPGPG